jgi:S-phase kinase-associated protein 1
MSEIKLKSKDEKEFSISEKAVKRSKLIEGIIEDYQDNKIIPLPDVDGKILEKIIEYLNHYENSEPKIIKKPLKNYKMNEAFEKWDYDYINNMNIEDIINLLNASNYMDIDSLVQLCKNKIAYDIIEKPIDEVINIFKIYNDLSEEENELMNKYSID